MHWEHMQLDGRTKLKQVRVGAKTRQYGAVETYRYGCPGKVVLAVHAQLHEQQVSGLYARLAEARGHVQVLIFVRQLILRADPL